MQEIGLEQPGSDLWGGGLDRGPGGVPGAAPGNGSFVYLFVGYRP